MIYKKCPQCKTNNASSRHEKCPLKKEGMTPIVPMRKCNCCDNCRSLCEQSI